MEDGRKIQAFGLEMLNCFSGLQPVNSANHVSKPFKAQLSHNLADFLSHKVHKSFNIFGFARESFSKPSVTRAAVPKPNRSAPSSAATTTSGPNREAGTLLPVFNWPSTCTLIRSRKPTKRDLIFSRSAVFRTSFVGR